MSDKRKYYYLKLKMNYFDKDSIVLLESMQDGILYSYILLKLYLKSLKHGGRPSSPTHSGTAISCPAVYAPASRRPGDRGRLLRNEGTHGEHPAQEGAEPAEPLSPRLHFCQ